MAAVVAGNGSVAVALRRLTSSTASPDDDRAESYMALSSFLKTGALSADVISGVTNQQQRLIELILSDVSSSCCEQAALQVLGYLIHCPWFATLLDDHIGVLFCRALSAEDVESVVKAVCTVISNLGSERSVCTRAIWCLANQSFTPAQISDHVTLIVTTVTRVVHSQRYATPTLNSEALNLLIRLSSQCPNAFHALSDVWYKTLTQLMLCRVTKIQRKALAFAEQFQLLLATKPDLQHWLVKKLKTEGITVLQHQLTERGQDHVLALNSWAHFVSVLGMILHKHGSFLNELLKVVETGFKHKIYMVQLAAYGAWRSLITNFALDTGVLTSNKRLKLLLMPLLSSAVRERHVKVEQVRIEVWWEIISCLGNHKERLFKQICIPFLLLCLGVDPKSDLSEVPCAISEVKLRPEGQSSKVDLQTTPPSTPENAPNRTDDISSEVMSTPQNLSGSLFSLVTTPKTPRPPAVARRGGDRYQTAPTLPMFLTGCHAMLRFLGCQDTVLGSLIPADESEIESKFTVFPKSVVPIEVAQFLLVFLDGVLKYSPHYSLDPDGAGKSVKEVVEKMAFVLVTSMLDCDPEDVKAASDVIGQVVCLLGGGALDAFVSSKRKMDLLSQLCKLPSSILHHGHGVWKRLPEILMRNGRSMSLWSKIVTVATTSQPHPLSDLLFLASESDRLAADRELQSDWLTLGNCWKHLAKAFTSFVSETSVINHGTDLEPDFTAARLILMFPFQHLAKYAHKINLSSMIDQWKESYSVVSMNISLAVKDPNLCAELVCNDLMTAYKSNIKLVSECTGDSLIHFSRFDHYQNAVAMALNHVIGRLHWGVFASQQGGGGGGGVRGGGGRGGGVRVVETLFGLLSWQLAAIWDTTEKTSVSLSELAAPLTLCETLTHLYQALPSSSLVSMATTHLAHPLTNVLERLLSEQPPPATHGSVMDHVSTLWRAVLTCYHSNFSADFDTQTLDSLSPLLVAMLTVQQPTLIDATLAFCATFNQSNQELVYPAKLMEVFKTLFKEGKCSFQLPGCRLSAVTVPVSPDQTAVLSRQEPSRQDVEPSAEVGVVLPNPSPRKGVCGSFLHRSPVKARPSPDRPAAAKRLEDILSRSPVKPISTSLPPPPSTDHLFTSVPPPPAKRRRLLTEHQKEVRRDRRRTGELPALFSSSLEPPSASLDEDSLQQSVDVADLLTPPIAPPTSLPFEVAMDTTSEAASSSSVSVPRSSTDPVPVSQPESSGMESDPAQKSVPIPLTGKPMDLDETPPIAPPHRNTKIAVSEPGNIPTVVMPTTTQPSNAMVTGSTTIEDVKTPAGDKLGVASSEVGVASAHRKAKVKRTHKTLADCLFSTPTELVAGGSSTPLSEATKPPRKRAKQATNNEPKAGDNATATKDDTAQTPSTVLASEKEKTSSGIPSSSSSSSSSSFSSYSPPLSSSIQTATTRSPVITRSKTTQRPVTSSSGPKQAVIPSTGAKPAATSSTTTKQTATSSRTTKQVIITSSSGVKQVIASSSGVKQTVTSSSSPRQSPVVHSAVVRSPAVGSRAVQSSVVGFAGAQLQLFSVPLVPSAGGGLGPHLVLNQALINSAIEQLLLQQGGLPANTHTAAVTMAPVSLGKKSVAVTTMAPVSLGAQSVSATTIAPVSLGAQSVAVTTMAAVSLGTQSVSATTIAPVSLGAQSVSATTIAPVSLGAQSVAVTTMAPVAVTATTPVSLAATTASLPPQVPATPSTLLVPSTGLHSISLPSAGLASTSLPSAGLASISLPSAGLASTSLASAGLASTSLASTGLASISLPSAGLAENTTASKPSLTQTSVSLLPASTLHSTSLASKPPASSTHSSTSLASEPPASSTHSSTSLASEPPASSTHSSTSLASKPPASSTHSSTSLTSEPPASSTLPSTALPSTALPSTALPSTAGVLQSDSVVTAVVHTVHPPIIALPAAVMATGPPAVSLPVAVMATEPPAVSLPAAVMATEPPAVSLPAAVMATGRPAVSLPAAVMATEPPAVSLPAAVMATEPPAVSLPAAVMATEPPAVSLPAAVMATEPPAVSLPAAVMATEPPAVSLPAAVMATEPPSAAQKTCAKDEAKTSTLQEIALSSNLSEDPLGRSEGVTGDAGDPLGRGEGVTGDAGDPLGRSEGVTGDAGDPLGRSEGVTGDAGDPLGRGEGVTGDGDGSQTSLFGTMETDSMEMEAAEVIHAKDGEVPDSKPLEPGNGVIGVESSPPVLKDIAKDSVAMETETSKPNMVDGIKPPMMSTPSKIACPSPLATPSGILKRTSQFDIPVSVCKSERRVQFSSDPLASAHSTDGFRTPKQSRSSRTPRRALQLSHTPVATPPSSSGGGTGPVYPSLADCSSPVEKVLYALSPSGQFHTRGLLQLVRAHKISTIGNLSSLSEEEVRALPIKSPKVETLRNTLRGFESTQGSKKKLAPPPAPPPATVPPTDPPKTLDSTAAAVVADGLAPSEEAGETRREEEEEGSAVSLDDVKASSIPCSSEDVITFSTPASQRHSEGDSGLSSNSDVVAILRVETESQVTSSVPQSDSHSSILHSPIPETQSESPPSDSQSSIPHSPVPESPVSQSSIPQALLHDHAYCSQDSESPRQQQPSHTHPDLSTADNRSKLSLVSNDHTYCSDSASNNELPTPGTELASSYGNAVPGGGLSSSAEVGGVPMSHLATVTGDCVRPPLTVEGGAVEEEEEEEGVTESDGPDVVVSAAVTEEGEEEFSFDHSAMETSQDMSPSVMNEISPPSDETTPTSDEAPPTYMQVEAPPTDPQLITPGGVVSSPPPLITPGGVVSSPPPERQDELTETTSALHFPSKQTSHDDDDNDPLKETDSSSAVIPLTDSISAVVPLTDSAPVPCQETDSTVSPVALTTLPLEAMTDTTLANRPLTELLALRQDCLRIAQLVVDTLVRRLDSDS